MKVSVRQPTATDSKCWAYTASDDEFGDAAIGGVCDPDALMCTEGSTGPLCG